VNAIAGTACSTHQPAVIGAGGVAPVLDEDAQHNLAGHGSVTKLLAAGARRRVLVLHDLDQAGSPNLSYSVAWYTLSAPSAVIGINSGGVFDSQAMTLVGYSDDLTSITIGLSQRPYDRLRTPWAGTQYQALFYDTSANAGDGTTEGLPGDFIPHEGHELIFDQTMTAAFLQRIAHYDIDPTDTRTWWQAQCRAVLMLHQPADDGSGVNPINGPTPIQIGYARGFDATTIDPAVLVGGTPNTIAYIDTTVPAGPDVPSVSMLVADGAGNIGSRTIPVGCYLESNDALEGLGLIIIGNTLLDCYDYSLGSGLSPKQAFDPKVWTELQAAIGHVDVVVVRVGGFLSMSFLNGSQNGNGWELIDTSDPETAPYGNYRGTVPEEMNDMLNVLRTNLGDTSRSLPFVFVLSHWTGGGTSLAQAELIRATFKRAITWGMSFPTDTPSHPTPAQVWLYNLALIDPWSDVSIEDLITGQGADQFIERGGLVVRGTWAAATNYVAGDVVIREEAADYFRSQWGWWVCKAGEDHTSAANGADGPPEDVAQTRWEFCIFRLNDAGKAREVTKIWELLHAAQAVVDAA